MLKEYNVSITISYSECIEAESPEKAMTIAERDCPYDGIYNISVVDAETGEEFEIS